MKAISVQPRRTSIDISTPCQIWDGDRTDQGYGRLMVDNRLLYVHRLAHQLHVGPIKRGWEIDHLCHNAAAAAGECGPGPCRHRACYNPAHLEAVTSATNSSRGGHPLYKIQRGNTCLRGHDLTDLGNVTWRSDGRRRCRLCDRQSQAARRARAAVV